MTSALSILTASALLRCKGRPMSTKMTSRIDDPKTKAEDALNMRGYRTRNQDGKLRGTRNDKRVDTIEKQYGRDFGVRGDMRLGTLLRKLGFESVHELIESDAGK
jgi:hypothetical protein